MEQLGIVGRQIVPGVLELARRAGGPPPDARRSPGSGCAGRPGDGARGHGRRAPMRRLDCRTRCAGRRAELRPRRSDGSTVTSGAPASTWVLVATRTSRTRPACVATIVISIFIASRTTTGDPASTSSPAATVTPTTSAGAGARTAPPRSRDTRCGDPLDLHDLIGAVGDRIDRERLLADHEPAREAPEGLDLHVGGRAVDLDPVAARPRLRDGETVGVAPVAEVDRPADLMTRLGPAATGGGVEGAALQLLLCVVRVDGGGEQGDVGVTRRDVAAARPRGDRASRCRPSRRSSPGGRADRAGGPCSSPPRGRPRSSPSVRGATVRAPRPGPSPSRRPWRSRGRTRGR